MGQLDGEVTKPDDPRSAAPVTVQVFSDYV
jgi:hypothetical protein